MECTPLQEGQVLLSPVKRIPQTEQINLASQNGHRFQCSFTALEHSGHEFDIKEYSHAGQSFQPFSTGSPQLGHTFFLSDRVIVINTKSDS
jgi:hypothetical protein